MYSNLSLYYLNQLGIRPWVHKEKMAVSQGKNTPNSSKLVVLLSAEPNSKERSLLKRIMSYVNVEEEELQIFTCDDFTSPDISQPRALLALGVDAQKLQITSNYPVFQSFSLDELLDKPANKKLIFQELNHLKTLLTQ